MQCAIFFEELGVYNFEGCLTPHSHLDGVQWSITKAWCSHGWKQRYQHKLNSSSLRVLEMHLKTQNASIAAVGIAELLLMD